MRFGSRAKAIGLTGLLQLGLLLPLAAQGSAEQYVPAAPIGRVSDFANVIDAADETRMTSTLPSSSISKTFSTSSSEKTCRRWVSRQRMRKLRSWSVNLASCHSLRVTTRSV